MNLIRQRRKLYRVDIEDLVTVFDFPWDPMAVEVLEYMMHQGASRGESFPMFGIRLEQRLVPEVLDRKQRFLQMALEEILERIIKLPSEKIGAVFAAARRCD